VPNPSGVNRRKRPARKKEPRFLRKAFPGYGRGAPVKVLRVLAWTIGIWFACSILLGDTGLFSIVRMHGMRDDLEAEMRALELEKAETEELRGNLENDPATIEKIAREEYGMIRDGEICYRIDAGDEEEE
jgi:cell division protein FtsB